MPQADKKSGAPTAQTGHGAAQENMAATGAAARPPGRLVDKANWPVAILCTLLLGVGVWAVVFSPLGMAGLSAITGGERILDFQLGYNSADAFIILAKLDEAGRDFYMERLLPLDFAFPLTYALCFGAWIALLLKRTTRRVAAQYWLALPIAAMLCDWVENICIFTMLWHFPDLPGWAVTIGSVAGVLKFVAMAASAVAVVVLAVKAITGRRGANADDEDADGGKPQPYKAGQGL